jgi:NAD+ synthase (glutamine-hydrolysing)
LALYEQKTLKDRALARTHPFHSSRTHGFVRVAAATPVVHTADPAANAAEHIALIRQAGAQGVDLIVFPELSLSGYAIDDLLMQAALLDEVERQIDVLAEATTGPAWPPWSARRSAAATACTTAPSCWGGRSEVLGVVPKTYLPNYREYYEKRWFSAGRRRPAIELNGERWGAFGTRLMFEAENRPGFVFGIEICEDYWAPLPPSTRQALAGARILLNLSASNVVIGKSDDRALLCASQSARAMAAYVFTASGWGESTTDLAWDGQATIHELGARLAEGERFALESHLTVADIDVERIGLERLRTGTFADCARRSSWATTTSTASCSRRARRPRTRPDPPPRPLPLRAGRSGAAGSGLLRGVQHPGAGPDAAAESDNGSKTLIIGVSGGLDSTQALLVACRAFDRLGLPRTGILAFTMPGFATSEGTKSNAWALMKALGITATRSTSARRPSHAEDIGHPYAKGEPVYDITFENVQAGLRTDYLFRLANQHRAFVLGTGDLSELALGWATYGVGDHMSHYNVNGGVAKTLIRHLIRWVADREHEGADRAGAARHPGHRDFARTGARQGRKIQSTEGTVGPYALNDFFLFYITRFGLKPSKVAYLAHQAWKDAATGHWPRACPRTNGSPTTCRPSRRGCGNSCPLLPDQPVQALGPAQRAQGRHRRFAVAPRRLAGAVGRRRRGCGWTSWTRTFRTGAFGGRARFRGGGRARGRSRGGGRLRPYARSGPAPGLHDRAQFAGQLGDQLADRLRIGRHRHLQHLDARPELLGLLLRDGLALVRSLVLTHGHRVDGGLRGANLLLVAAGNRGQRRRQRRAGAGHGPGHEDTLWFMAAQARAICPARQGRRTGDGAAGLRYLPAMTDAPTRDSNGNPLADGDSVTLIKDLKVKGSGGVTLKRGTMVRNIRLTDDPAEIEANVEKVRGLVLRTEFVRKA